MANYIVSSNCLKTQYSAILYHDVLTVWCIVKDIENNCDDNLVPDLV